jgi:hypothetical protein
MPKRQYQLAGWLSLVSAAVSMIPFFAMMISTPDEEVVMDKGFSAALTLVSLGLMVYVLVSFRRLLHQRFQFHDLDGLITLLLWGNGLLSALSLVSEGLGPVEWAAEGLMIASLVFSAVLSIAFGSRLLRLKDHFFGLLRPYAYSTVAMGVCFATMALAPLGILLGSVADVILGTVFFRAAEEPPIPPGSGFKPRQEWPGRNGTDE